MKERNKRDKILWYDNVQFNMQMGIQHNRNKPLNETTVLLKENVRARYHWFLNRYLLRNMACCIMIITKWTACQS